MLLFLHLCSTNYRLANPVAASNHHLLSQEDLLCGDLDTHVSTGNHDTITGLQNLFKTGERVRKQSKAKHIQIKQLIKTMQIMAKQNSKFT